MKRVIKLNPRHEEYEEYLYNHIQGVIDSWDILLRPELESRLDEFDIDEDTLRKIDKIVENHDDSKWDDPEWTAYLNHYYPTPEFPNNLQDYDFAWLHHQNCNKHHWQYWVLIKDEGDIRALDMPFEHICEMICDWHSFSARDEESSAYVWYQNNSDRFILSTRTKEILESLIVFLKTPLHDIYENA